MSYPTAWHKAFLGGQSTLAVKALHEAWTALATSAPETFGPHAQEPALTAILCEQLVANRMQDRLSGLWSYEVRQGRLVRSGKRVAVVDRKRTDIQYFTDSEQPALKLIFEFKRLDHQLSRRKKYTGEDGMMRFITGEYSVGEPVAVMVGILTAHRDDCVPPLEIWLNSPDAKTELAIQPFGATQTRSPSEFFSSAVFDTEHLRPAGKGPGHGTIVISHLFLDFPGLARRAVKKRRAMAKS